MILLREIQERDLDSLEQFSQVPGFINLTGDRDLLKEKITRSITSFNVPLKDLVPNQFEGKFIFIAEEVESKKVLGTSMIASQHGTQESPHFYLELGSEKKFSDMINTEFIHGTLKLKYDTNGPSEIGGLILNPDYRNSNERIGRQIFFVRFLYLALNRSRFKRKILAELLPPLNKKGQSPLWEAIGRRFTNMDYWEADELCQKNKEFIFSLFPTGKMYTTFFSAEARNAIGKVGRDTEPVLHMLKKIGFQYKNQVDPFDGGPHLWANVDELLPLKRLGQFSLVCGSADSFNEGDQTQGLLCPTQSKLGEFRAVSVHVITHNGKLRILEPKEARAESVLGLKDGDAVTFMPYY